MHDDKVCMSKCMKLKTSHYSHIIHSLSLNADSSIMLNWCDNAVCGKECTVVANQYFYSVEWITVVGIQSTMLKKG